MSGSPGKGMSFRSRPAVSRIRKAPMNAITPSAAT
ncbi:Uncharacterised protein [Bordetella pertussis]|nr:Uncharacterised protein [Bordetella pertussis]